MPDIEKKIALVLGASGGIGSAVVAELRRGDVGVAAMDLEPGPEGLADPDCLWLQGDATDEKYMQEAIKEVVDRFGRIDYSINMVGRVGQGKLDEMSYTEWQAVLDANLNSCFLLARHCYSHLKKTSGCMVFCSSTNALNGGSQWSGAAYAAAKAAIINLGRYLAKEWAPDGIRINCVAPGPVDTRMLRRFSDSQLEKISSAIPLGRLADATEVADAVVYLCSESARSITGAVINISGGLVLD